MTPAIEVCQVHKRFPRVHAQAGVDLEIAPGEFFGLLGTNGAGKTTLINCLAGLARADSGILRVMGRDVRTEYREARRSLGVVPQELVFDPFFSVRECLRIQSGYFGLKRNDAWIDKVMHHLVLNGFMAFPNLIGRAFLGGTVAKLTKDYFSGAGKYNTVPDAPGVGQV